MGIRKKRLRVVLMFFVILAGLTYFGYRLTRPLIKTEDTAQAPTCNTGKPAHASLDKSSDAILRKLQDYEAVCKGTVTDTMMLFIAMPATNEEAATFAKNTATRIKEFSKYNIKPLVSFEPNIAMPTIISDIRAGTYDTILTSYFQNLKAEGISSKQMGTWILFPEANTPTWHNTDSATFAANVIKVATIQRQFFPDCDLTILLNSTTYASEDTQWSHGTKKDLRPYVSAIPDGTIDSFGYQGFPFIAPKNAPSSYGQLDAKDFLQLADARHAATELNTKKIWINTGTFRRAHTENVAEEVNLSLSQRKKTLSSITHQVGQLKDQGFTISVNIFAKDKSNEAEHIDWSYWPTGKYAESPDMPLLRETLEQLHERDIPISLHDAV